MTNGFTFQGENTMNCYVYLLQCGDGTLYCGWTNDMRVRLAAHQSGRGAKYTRAHAPVIPVYLEQCADKSAALRREHALKKLTRAQKLELIKAHAAESKALLLSCLIASC